MILSFKNPRGFSLVEMLIIVAIIGLLAAIGSSSFVRYLKQSKTSEAHLQLKSLGDSAAQYYQVDQYDQDGQPISVKMFPTPSGTVGDTSASTRPDTVPRKGKVLLSRTQWEQSPWQEMKFIVTKPHYYQYSYAATNGSVTPSFVGAAHGDLDGDTVTSRYTVNGKANTQTDSLYISPVLVDLNNPLE